MALTLLTLTVAGTVFMAVFSIRASLYSTLDDALDYFRYDISVGFSQNYRAARIEHEILEVPGVKAAEPLGFTSGRLLRNERKESEDEASKNVFILAPPVSTQMIHPKMIEDVGCWMKTRALGIPELEIAGKVKAIRAYGEKKRGDITYTVTVAPERWDDRLRWNMTAQLAIMPSDL